jgi:uncharacterized protein YheU (UPF0270 family)
MLPIPPEALSPEVLTALIEEFVTRHGTDLAEADAKIASVRRQLRSGQIIIAWDEKSQSANIVAKDAKEEPAPPPLPPQPPTGPRAKRTYADEDGRHIVYDEPAPPDPTDF